MNYTYANKITVTFSETEAYISFAFTAPDYDEKGNITGGKVVEEKTIVMSRSTAKSLEDLLHSLRTEGKESEA